jgi:hypothetical protein
MRDTNILAVMGPAWEVVHYPVVFVDKHLVKLVQGVKNLARKQREIRSQYGLGKKIDFMDELKKTQSKLLKEKAVNNR